VFRTFLKAKIHQARVTDVHLEYSGSMSIDPEIMEEVGILPNEQINIFNANNGERFETYAILGKRGSKEFCVNGAAARKVYKGDTIIIVTYAVLSEEEIKTFKPKVACMDENNNIIEML